MFEKEAEEYAEGMAKYYASTHEDCIPSQFEKYLRNAYISSAEPREKRIAELTEQNISLLTSVENLNKSVQELEDKLANADYQLEGRDNEIRELKAQIEKMKCCYNCSKWNDGECEESPKSKTFFCADFKCDNWEMFK